MYSIRRFLSLWILGALILGGLFAARASYYDTSHEVIELFDAELAQLARLVAGLLDPNNNPAQYQRIQQILQESPHLQLMDESEDDDMPDAFGHPYESKIALQVFNEQGDRLFASNQTLNEIYIPLKAGYHQITQDPHDWRGFVLHDMRHQRWIWVAQDQDIRREVTREISIHAMLPLLANVGIVFILISFFIRRGFAPMDQLTARISEQSAEKLQTIELQHTPQEVSALLNAFNRMVERVNTTFERERQFSANAAHELRTPLAALKIHLQNAQKMDDPQTKQLSITHALTGISRLTHVVEQLLILSRLIHAPNPDTVHEEVALHALTTSIAAELYPMIERKQLQLDIAPPSPVIKLQSHALLLRLLLRNLIDNAIQYTPEGGQIAIEYRQSAEQVIWQICDTGPGIDPTLYETIFHPFFRAHGQEVAGSGIGLAIVKEIAEQLSIQITLHPNPQHRSGLCVRLLFRQT